MNTGNRYNYPLVLLMLTSRLLPLPVSTLLLTACVAPVEISTEELVRRHGPSVVAVHLTVEDMHIHPGMGPQEHQGGGSGFVVDDAGHIVTNFHVVALALEDREDNGDALELRPGATITVTFIERPDAPVPVRVLGANPDFDLAVLELLNPADRPDVVPLSLGNSNDVRAGERAIAIGSPFGLHSSVTSGIVSAIERERPGLVGIEIPFLQTDAAINPGNSGGPLFNGRGEVIGINNHILASGAGPGAFIGVGFAVPVNLLIDSMDELLAGGLSGVAAAVAELPDRPRMGLSAAFTVDDYPPPLRREMGLPEHGIVVTEVSPGGPAERAGLNPPTGVMMVAGQALPVGGDIIVAMEGQKTRRVIDLQRIVLEREAGDTVSLRVWNDGQVRSVEVTLEVVATD